MSQAPQTLFHSLLQDKTPAVSHRNSDDFFPDVTDSNPWHIFVNAHNALLDRHLNVVPDWDMFQTGLSALLRSPRHNHHSTSTLAFISMPSSQRAPQEQSAHPSQTQTN